MGEASAAQRLLIESDKNHLPIEAQYAKVLREEEEMADRMRRIYKATWLELVAPSS